jgi:hypothetical protein
MVVQAIYDGRSIKPLDREVGRLDAYKQGLTKGDRITLQFDKTSEVRTRLQQGLFHELIGRYARAMGESMADVKLRMKADLGYWLPADKLLAGEIPLPKWRGSWTDLHELYPLLFTERYIVFLRSEADYTRKMSSELTEYAIKYCQENGVNIDDILHTLAAHD